MIWILLGLIVVAMLLAFVAWNQEQAHRLTQNDDEVSE